MKVDNNVSLESLSTFKMKGVAPMVITLETEAEVVDFFNSNTEPCLVLGGGSNVILPDGVLKLAVIKSGFTHLEYIPNEETVLVKAGSGLSWDGLVAKTVHDGLSGLEALSAIPGLVGASPIQNIGAYGAEVSQVIDRVRAYDMENKQFVDLKNNDCQFSYRDSIFKRHKNRYFITEVVFILNKRSPQIPKYQEVANYFETRQIIEPTLEQTREAIIAIRANKLPDPKIVASVGSFFKNPIIKITEANELKEKYPKLAVFPVNEGLAKIGAGSLLDVACFKGRDFGSLKFYENHALVLTNKGDTTLAEVERVIMEVKEKIKELFGVELEVEPEIIAA